MEDEIIEFLKNNNENSTYQNPWDIFKTMIRGNFIALRTFPNKNEWK